MEKTNNQEPLRVMALHSLSYCERLFYLEEVEQILIANARVHARRRLHLNLAANESGEWVEYDLEDKNLGLKGKVDCLRRVDGTIIPYEHKRGRSHRAAEGIQVQALAYEMLVRACLGFDIKEVRVRYHADNKMVRIPLDNQGCSDVEEVIQRARHLRTSLQRPPITEHEKRCINCSLAPVCLPEEERLNEGRDKH